LTERKGLDAELNDLKKMAENMGKYDESQQE